MNFRRRRQRVARLRRLGLGALVALGALFVPPVAHAQGGQGPDNVATATNTHDGKEIFKLAFSIDRIMRDNSDPDNAAIAVSSCEACETTAIAIQVVLISSVPEEFSPANLAIAINEQCTSCETVALAYQIILQTDGPVKISPEGHKRIAEILNEIKKLEDLDLSPEELEARVDPLVDELAQIIAEETEAVGGPKKDKQTSTPDPNASSAPSSSEPPSDGSPAPDASPAATDDPSATTSPTDDPASTSDPSSSSEPASEPQSSP